MDYHSYKTHERGIVLNTSNAMGNYARATYITVFSALIMSAFLFLSFPQPAAAFWPGFPFGNGSFEKSNGHSNEPNAHAMVVARLCERQDALGSRLPRPLIDPDICHPPAEPTVDIDAEPMAIEEGDTSTLSWESTDADSCEGDWTDDPLDTSGDDEVTPSETTLYTITCSGPGGEAMDSVTVTVTPTPEAATLTLMKTVVNDDGGTASSTAFQAKIDGVNVTWGVAHEVTPGAHTASEAGLGGYAASDWGGDCAANGSVTLSAGEHKTCTITNDDMGGTLHVVKVVVNDNDGTATTSDFAFSVNGGPATSFEADGHNDIAVDAGTYTVVESAAAGYTPSYDNCTDVVIPLGGEATCTITNNDNAPETATLTLMKTVVNDNDGTASTSDFQAQLDGNNVNWGEAMVVAVGAHTASEINVDGYTASDWGGDCAANGTITLAAGEDKTCTITNDDDAPAPTGKVVINEVLYDLATSSPVQGDEPGNEWVEIYNGTNADINLSNYKIGDSAGVDVLPDVVLPAGGFAIVTSTSTTESFYTFPEGTVVVVLGSSIGSNGLGNAGDEVRLLLSDDTSVDAVSWGTDVTAFDPSVAVVEANVGHSIGRVDKTVDTDTAGDWQEQEPNPGA